MRGSFWQGDYRQTPECKRTPDCVRRSPKGPHADAVLDTYILYLAGHGAGLPFGGGGRGEGGLCTRPLFSRQLASSWSVCDNLPESDSGGCFGGRLNLARLLKLPTISQQGTDRVSFAALSCPGRRCARHEPRARTRDEGSDRGALPPNQSGRRSRASGRLEPSRGSRRAAAAKRA